jgi:four helix bundle protein
MRNPKNLSFWPEVTQFIVRIYRLAGTLPRQELYNLTSQIKRAAVSIRLNIVEGAACDCPAEFARYLEIAYRSLREVLTCVELAAELQFVKADAIQGLLDFGDRLAGAIYAYRRSLQRPPSPVTEADSR